jgi:hypothetical protein
MAAVFTEIRRCRVSRKCHGGCGHWIQEGDFYERIATKWGDGRWTIFVQHTGEEYMLGLLRPGEYQAPDRPGEAMDWQRDGYR